MAKRGGSGNNLELIVGKIDRTAAARQRARRAKLAGYGLRQRTVYVHDDDWQAVKERVNKMMSVRLNGKSPRPL